MYKQTQWLLGFLALVLTGPVRAEIWIKDFQGQPQNFRLQRNGRELPIQHYLVLKTGDQLWVDKDHELHLEAADGKVVIVKAANSPYPVQDVGKTPGVLTNLASWAGEWFQNKVGYGRTAQPVVTLVTRGEIVPITLPLTPQEPVRIMAGSRPVHLAWEGGNPPYRVQLLGRDSKTVILDQQGLKETRYDSPPVNLTPGFYEMTVADQDRKTTVAIEVVPSDALPKPPVELAPTTGVDSAKETIYALWLSAQGREWMLEAYQRVVFWQDQHLPARWLTRSLEKGVRPKPPT